MRKAISRAALLLSTATIGAMPLAANAGEAWPNWYLGLAADMAFLSDADLSGGGSSGSLEHESGRAFAVQLGYTHDSWATRGVGAWRVEAEYFNHAADNDSITFGGATGAASGDTALHAGLLNAYYDFAMTGTRWSPYVGAGIGFADVSLDTNSTPLTVHDSDTVLAYQLLAGVGYSPESLPHTTWSVGYRFFNTADPEFTSSTGAKIDSEVMSHTIEAGLKMRF